MRWIAVAVALFAAGCRSKQERCNAVCEKIEAEDLVKCAGPTGDACRLQVVENKDACTDLCAVVAGVKAPAPAVADVTRAERDCDRGDAEACKDAGGMYLLGRGGAAKDEARARALFDKSCGLGSAFACEAFAKMLRDGRGGAPEPDRAWELLARACDDGAAGACASVGLQALARDKKRGVALLTRACDGGDGIGCTGLAGLYLHGNGVHRDKAKAKDLLRRACDLKSAAACDKLHQLGG